ncbi:ABC transporter substrate-binding protein [Rhodococcus sp. 14-2483-1-2]|uniref:ABC transporter substrate-binding protein n=1 Tax=Rhodococcus sp. 14-2483-1-2 TaxID=2023147 RepID=UPI000B9A5C89|nr:ABC transporter substrate-binding protein [Rhodococcus sp. 14-2483-1-2]OZF26094.1 hypothetical protein CH295_26055 [Rhodococcus sp. 14-2483-1-2]
MKHTIRLSTIALTLAFAAGCAASPADEVPNETRTRTVTHELGVTEVPVDPERIVATDEYAAMSLLAVGIVPDVVFTGFGSAIGGTVLRNAGAQVIDVPPVGAPPTEEILAEQPDLVVGSDYGDPTVYEAISDTVAMVPMPYASPWKESLEFTATMFDRHDEAARLRTMLDTEIDSLRSTVTTDPTSLSVLMYSSDILAVATGISPSSSMAARVGITAPTLQTAASAAPWTALSPELLPEQAADVVVVFDEGVYSADRVRGVTESAGITGNAVNVNGEMWFANHPFATYWLVRDLRALIAGDTSDIGTEDTAADRYTDFQAELR